MQGKNTIFARGLAVTAAATLSACSLWNPYVTWDPIQETDTVTIERAIVYANAAKAAYKEALGDQAILTNTLATGLIPLGGATLGAGIAGVNAEPLAYLALAGATVFGLGTWLNSTPRQSVYIAGINGMTCAVEAVLPLKFDADQLDEALSKLSEQAGKTEHHAREAERLASELKGLAGRDTPLTTSAVQSISSARAIMTTAQGRYGDGVSLKGLAARAGQLLVAKVDDIDALVGKQLLSTQPDLQSLPALIKGLGQTARNLTPLPSDATQLLTEEGLQAARADRIKTESQLVEARKEPELRVAGLEEKLDKSLEMMNEAVGPLVAASNTVAAFVNSATRSKPSETLKACGVDEVETGFTVRPAGDLVLPQGKTIQLSIRGGKTPYKAHISPQPADKISLLQPIGGGSTVVISAAEDATGAEYQLLIEDATLNQTSVKLTVPKKTGAADTKKSPDVSALEELEKSVPVGTEIELHGGKFAVVAKQIDRAEGLFVVTLGSDGNHDKDADLVDLKKKIVELNRTNPVPTDMIKIDNHDDIKLAGAVFRLPDQADDDVPVAPAADDAGGVADPSAPVPDDPALTPPPSTAVSPVDPAVLNEFARRLPDNSEEFDGITVGVAETVPLPAVGLILVLLQVTPAEAAVDDDAIKSWLLTKRQAGEEAIDAANLRLVLQ